ncbi:MAG: hypothetical protein J6Q83_05870 [Clostridia bacterium]|nr:hypothetical protein [Clostridia bacterium]
MSEGYKVGLSRNRLFEFNNAVTFCGKLAEGDKESLSRALKLLCLKEPVITTVAVIGEDGECSIVPESVEQELVFSGESAREIKCGFAENGLCFSKKLFEFVVSCDGFLVIAAHTLVADCKSLLRLAMSFSSLCKAGATSVVPSCVEVFSDMTGLPLEVNSPLTDKLAAELDDGWQRVSQVFTEADYKMARVRYCESRKFSDEVALELDSACTSKLLSFCEEQGADLSSVVAFAFYKALCDKLKPTKKQGRACIHADRRLFLQDCGNVLVGPFNGFCEASLNTKEMALDLKGQIKAFHNSCYKGVTSPFKTFYDEFLFMKTSPSYCDSAYMYLAGCVKDKASRKLAQNYGCMNEQLCEFFSCNLEQKYWSELKSYSDISVSEPLKERFGASISLLRVDGACKITLRFNERRVDKPCADAVINGAKSILEQI